MKQTLLALLLISALLALGCAQEQPPAAEPVQEVPQQPAEPEVNEPEETFDDLPPEPEPLIEAEADSEPEVQEPEPVVEESSDILEPQALSEWMTAELTDVATGQSFTIGDFDKPVILESFAVWCPKCTSQQKTIQELHEEVGDDVISISLNTDPNEDEKKIQDHLDRHGFDWYYAVSPVEVTKDLIAEFGNGVVNAPSVPVIIVCPDNTATFLGRGQKSIDDLKVAVGECSA